MSDAPDPLPGPAPGTVDRQPGSGRARKTSASSLLALLLSACTTTGAFRDHYEAGRYDDAASAFHADSSLHEDEEALYRMALMQASVDSPVRDLERAAGTLRRLVELHPDGDRGREARVLLSLLEEAWDLRRQLEELKAVDLEGSASDEDGPPRRQ